VKGQHRDCPLFYRDNTMMPLGDAKKMTKSNVKAMQGRLGPAAFPQCWLFRPAALSRTGVGKLTISQTSAHSCHTLLGLLPAAPWANMCRTAAFGGGPDYVQQSRSTEKRSGR
jgi:hypothetical protein